MNGFQGISEAFQRRSNGVSETFQIDYGDLLGVSMGLWIHGRLEACQERFKGF